MLSRCNLARVAKNSPRHVILCDAAPPFSFRHEIIELSDISLKVDGRALHNTKLLLSCNVNMILSLQYRGKRSEKMRFLTEAPNFNNGRFRGNERKAGIGEGRIGGTPSQRTRHLTSKH